MKKEFSIIILTLLLASVNLFSQVKLSAQLGMAFPTGNFANTISTGYGIEGNIEFPQDANFSIGGTVGYYWWGPYVPWYLGPNDEYSSLQILFGIRYEFSQKRIHPYIGFDAGMNSLNFSRTYSYSYTYNTVYQITQTRFNITPIFGLLFRLNHGMDLDINFKYSFTSSAQYNGITFPTSFFSLNGGLRFEL